MIHFNKCRIRINRKIIYTEPESFSVHPGEVCILTGENGAGKTTLLNSVIGQTNIFRGDIKLSLDKHCTITPTNRTKLEQLANNGVGISFQEPILHPEMNVDETLSLLPSKTILPTSVHEYFCENGIMNSQCGELSYGEKKLVCLSIALAVGKKICLLDEPFAGANEDTVPYIAKFIDDHKKLKSAILIVEHRHDDVNEIHEKIVEVKCND
ncbi:MAG: ATP-binding cassette domain-containing protein [Candidatus Thiodiazotropha sp. 6PDIVS]